MGQTIESKNKTLVLEAFRTRSSIKRDDELYCLPTTSRTRRRIRRYRKLLYEIKMCQ
jgi:hypothetical protein